MTAPRLLLWCLAGGALVQIALWRAAGGNPHGFSLSFLHLLAAFDTHGNALLCLVAVLAFLLRGQPAVAGAIRFAAERPWAIAGALFLLLCAGALGVYHNHALAMDEYAPLFQSQAFAAGRLAGQLPPDLLDRLVPTFFQPYFFGVARETGEISSRYWPGFALLLAPFSWLGIPWAANPAIGALTVPALHRLAELATGSREAAGWAVVIAVASPAFIVNAISYYSMPAHLLCNVLFALLLLRPTPQRALLAGLVGSLALTLHQPAPHLLFSLAFFGWLLWRRSFAVLGALVLGYIPLVLLLGVGWHVHIQELSRAAQGAGAATAAAATSVADSLATAVRAALSPPSWNVVEARIAGLSKAWTWGAAGLLVLAAWGFWRARARTEVRLLGAALAVTFFGYFLATSDQGHGWGFRYLHSAWFVLPLFAAIPLGGKPSEIKTETRTMVGWGVMLSLALANGLRLAQVEDFVGRHLAQIPPLARTNAHPEIVFVNIRRGFYTQDLVQNDPFLRRSRLVMVSNGPEGDAAFAAKRFPAYRKTEEGAWGSAWTSPAR
jgi:hypothetical protein